MLRISVLVVFFGLANLLGVRTARKSRLLRRQSRIQKKTYDFKEAGKEMEYALFVPTTYDKDKKSPLIVALHGLGSNPQQIMHYRGLTDLAEKHGYIVVAPMGYNSGGWYGVKIPAKFAKDAPKNLAELSEKDVMNVLALTRKEFNIDNDRIYLMGHSMGGGGTIHLALKNPDLWAALGPIAPALFRSPEELEKIKHVPIILVQGDKDKLVPVAQVPPVGQPNEETGDEIRVPRGGRRRPRQCGVSEDAGYLRVLRQTQEGSETQVTRWLKPLKTSEIALLFFGSPRYHLPPDGFPQANINTEVDMISRQAIWQALAIAVSTLAAVAAHAQLIAQTPKGTAPTTSAGTVQIIPVSLKNDSVAATVNGEKILVGDVKKILDHDRRPYPVTLTEEQKKQLRQAALDVLVEDILMRQYLNKHVTQVDQGEFKKEVQKLTDALKAEKKTIEMFLKENGQTEEQFAATSSPSCNGCRFCSDFAPMTRPEFITTRTSCSSTRFLSARATF